jgi:NADH:ubiquinone oxidoreductase subunit E
LEKCSKGPTVEIAGETIEHCTPEAAENAIRTKLNDLPNR